MYFENMFQKFLYPELIGNENVNHISIGYNIKRTGCFFVKHENQISANVNH